MVYIAVILFAIANIAMAKHHSNLMAQGKEINHGVWLGAYLLLIAPIAYLNDSFLLFLDAIFIRKVVFDLSLNLFNRRPLLFVSTETGSLFDQLHYKIFGKRSWIYMLVYTILIVVITWELKSGISGVY